MTGIIDSDDTGLAARTKINAVITDVETIKTDGTTDQIARDAAAAAAALAVNSSLNGEASNTGFTAAAGGVAYDAYTATLSGVTAYVEGFRFNIKAQATSTGPAKFNINSLGLIDAETSDGSPFRIGTVQANSIYAAVVIVEQSTFKLRLMTSWDEFYAEDVNANGSLILRNDGVLKQRKRAAGAGGIDVVTENWDATLNGGAGDWVEIERHDGSTGAKRFAATPSVGATQSTKAAIFHENNPPEYVKTSVSAVYAQLREPVGMLAGTVDDFESVRITEDNTIFYLQAAHIGRLIDVNADNVTIMAHDLTQGFSNPIEVNGTGCKLWIGVSNTWRTGSVVTAELIDLPDDWAGIYTRVVGTQSRLVTHNGTPANSAGSLPVGLKHGIIGGQSLSVRLGERSGLVGFQNYLLGKDTAEAPRYFWTSTGDGASSLIPRDASDTDNWLNTNLSKGPHYTAMEADVLVSTGTHGQPTPTFMIWRQGTGNVGTIGDYVSLTEYRDAIVALSDLLVADYGAAFKLIIQPFGGLNNSINPFQMWAIRYAQSLAADLRPNNIHIGMPTYQEHRPFNNAHQSLGGGIESGINMGKAVDYFLNGVTSGNELGPEVQPPLCYRYSDDEVAVCFDRETLVKIGNDAFIKGMVRSFGFFVSPTGGADADADLDSLLTLDEDDLHLPVNGSWSNNYYIFRFAAGTLPANVTVASIFGQMEMERVTRTYVMENTAHLVLRHALPQVTKPNLLLDHDMTDFTLSADWTVNSDGAAVYETGDGDYISQTVAGLADVSTDFLLSFVIEDYTAGQLVPRLDGASLVSGSNISEGGVFEVPLTATPDSGEVMVRLDPNAGFNGKITRCILTLA